MVQNTVHATYTETYDLNTALGELSMLGIHTPQAQAVKKMFKGFFEQYKKYKILGCNLSMVCASQQALTPDLVGQESGQVDARDVLNPILFKACTGESMNALLDQIYNASLSSGSDGLNSSVNEVHNSSNAAINAYYQFLADDTFRKEHPQRGLTVMGLRPFVHKVVTTQPFKWTGVSRTPTASSSVTSGPLIGSALGPMGTSSALGFGADSGSVVSGVNYDATNPSVFVSDGITDMPWLETTAVKQVDTAQGSGEDYGTAWGRFAITDIPRVYCGLIVLPPAHVQRLFFRLSIVWHIQFKDFRPAYEVGPIESVSDIIGPEYSGIANSGSTYNPVNTTYFNIYHNAVNTKMPNEVSSFSTTEATEVESVVEKVA